MSISLFNSSGLQPSVVAPLVTTVFPNLPITVPANFMGMCWMEWPNAIYHGAPSEPSSTLPNTTTGLAVQTYRFQTYEQFWWRMHVSAINGYISGNTMNIVSYMNSNLVANGFSYLANGTVLAANLASGQYIYTAGISNANVSIVSGAGTSWQLSNNLGTMGSAGSPIQIDIIDNNMLANVDSIITYQRSEGVTIYWVHGGTPTFYAQTYPNPTWPDYLTNDPGWSHEGAPSVPTNYQGMTNYLQFIINHYNKPGGGWYNQYHSLYGKGVQMMELWNEPEWNIPSGGTNGNGNIGGAGAYGAGWWMACNDFIDMCHIAYTAVKAVDPTVIITTAGFSPSGVGAIGANSHLSMFMLNTGNVYSTITGSQCVDGVAWHPYSCNPPGYTVTSWASNPAGIITNTSSNGALDVRNWLNAYGFSSYKLYNSEYGIDGGGAITTPSVAMWYAGPASMRYTWVARNIMCQAACGVQFHNFWHYNETGAVYYGYISGTNLTLISAQNSVAANTLGTVGIGDTIYHAGNNAPNLIAPGTIITGGSHPNYTVNISQTVGSAGAPVQFHNYAQAGNSGDWQTDVNGCIAAYLDCARILPGKTIIGQSCYTLGGPIHLEFSDGTSWTV